MSLNDWVQCASVVILLIICAVWIVRRIMRKRDGDDDCEINDACAECKLARHCNKRNDAERK